MQRCDVDTHSCVIYIFFFFFQAEDGIRDYKVTGVQTCALPIYHRNEDAMALATADTATGPAVVAVVCDGVSSSAHPDEASLAAARAAAGVLLTAVRTGADLLT